MMPKNNKFYVCKEYFSFFQNKDKKMLLLQMLVRKAKENLNLSESDQQTSTASTQITTNKDSCVFLHKRNQVINFLLKLLLKYKIYIIYLIFFVLVCSYEFSSFYLHNRLGSCQLQNGRFNCMQETK